jgi:hypothetical protein
VRVDVEQLDATILSHACERWLKAAMITARTMQDRGLDPADEQLGIVVARVRALVAQGRLVAQGEPSRPRFSEVRLPGAESGVSARRRILRQ